MVSSRTFIVLAAALAVASAATSHIPSRWVSAQRPSPPPPTTTPPPPPPPPTMVTPPAQNTSGSSDIKDKFTQLMALIIPKIQQKISVLLTNIGRAVAGAISTTFKTGFKPLTVMFTVADKATFAPQHPVNDYMPQELGEYIGEEEELKTQEPSEVDTQATERKLR